MNVYMDLPSWYRIFHRLNEITEGETIYSMLPWERDLRIAMFMDDVERAKKEREQQS